MHSGLTEARLAVETTRTTTARISYLIDDLLCEPTINARERAALLRARMVLFSQVAAAQQSKPERSRRLPPK